MAFNDRNLLGVVSVGCLACGLVQTNPRPTPDGLDRFYRQHYRLFYQGAAAPDAEYIASLNKDVRLGKTASFLASLSSLPPAEVSILDYGCGEGSLFRALRKAGFGGRFFGVELNASFGKFAESHGGASVFDSIAKTEPADLITVNHVLEHLPDPIATLRELADKLNPGGRLYIDVPDAEEYSSIQDLHIAHIFHFSVRTLRRLAEKAGLQVILVEKHAPPFHPRSIRLVAARGESAPAATPDVYTSAQEQSAWAAVRRAGRFRNTLRLRLRRFAIARSAYGLGKKLIGTRQQPRA